MNEGGEYKAYLRISAVPFDKANADTRVVRFANPDIFREDIGANYIGSFKL